MNRRVLIVVFLMLALAIAALFLTLDPASAAFLTFAFLLVSLLGAVPVIFSVRTRRKAREYNERLDRESELVFPHKQRADDDQRYADHP